METTIAQRIRDIFRAKHFNATTFAELAGLQAVTINRQLKGSNPIGYMKTLNRYMQHVRDLFLMQVFTGIAVGDLMTIDFRTAVQGDIIKGKRGKTGVEFTTVLLPQARNILEHYRYKLPVMAYDDYRRMIQPTLQAAGIEKENISSHNARHTFATTVTLAHGVPMETVSKMLGHTSVKTTQIYAKVLDTSVQSEAQKLAAALAL